MADSEGLGVGLLRGLMKVAIMELMRGVGTISLRGRGGREEGRSGRIGVGEGRGLVTGRRIAGISDLVERGGIERWCGIGEQQRRSGCVTIDR